VKAVWIALLAVGVSLLSTFVAIYAAQTKARSDSQDAPGSSGDSAPASDCGSDGGDGGCD
jgi:hypothetical protein